MSEDPRVLFPLLGNGSAIGHSKSNVWKERSAILSMINGSYFRRKSIVPKYIKRKKFDLLWLLGKFWLVERTQSGVCFCH